MITPRENLQKVFRHEMPEWIPVVTHVDGHNQPCRKDMDPTLARRLDAEDPESSHSIILARYLGLDILDYIRSPVVTKQRTVTIERIEEGNTRTTIHHTPQGELRQVSQCPPGGKSYTVERVVKGPEDLPRLAAMYEDVEYSLDADKMERVQMRRKNIGDEGMLMFFMPGTPLGMMYRCYTGVDTLAYLWMDAPAAMHDLFKVMEDCYERMFRLAVTSCEADALVGMDDTSTTVISPRMFEEFNLDCTNQRADICHAAKKLYFHHSCGLIRNLLGLYRQTRMDAVHAFTTPPIGDVTIAEGRQKLGSKITILAILGQLAEDMADRRAVAKSIRTMFDESAPGDHFIPFLVPDPGKTMAETAFVANECKKYRRCSYP